MPCHSCIGRFAPSPTGPLHAGSIVAALASWLDARAHGGIWLVRMEDVDTPRCAPGVAQTILSQLAACGLVSDAPVLWQSSRLDNYRKALDVLLGLNMAYPCACSRSDIAAAQARLGLVSQRHQTLPYPGTCRNGLNGRTARAWRFRTDVLRNGTATNTVIWRDRRLGPQSQDVGDKVGDFVLRRADGLWAYQLAVVVDDALQGVTDVVRGEDLADNTARQILLQRALNLPTPRYLHTPLVLGADGEKLSKQNGAAPIDTRHPLRVLGNAAQALGLPPAPECASVAEALAFQVNAWRSLWVDDDRHA